MQGRKGVVAFYTAILLMVILGIARGIGGVVIISHGAEAVPGSTASEGVLVGIGLGLLLITIAELAAAVGLYFRRRFFWKMGIYATIAFVLGGAVNGYILYGAPTGGGTVLNVVAAVIIIGLLYAGKDQLK